MMDDVPQVQDEHFLRQDVQDLGFRVLGFRV